MKAPSSPVPVRFMLMFGALLLGISSCRFMPSGPPHGMRTLPLPPTRASVLVIIADPDSPSAMRATGALVAASARPAEQVVILELAGSSNPGLIEGPSLPQPSSIRAAGITPPAPDQLPEGPLPAGRPAIPEHDHSRPGDAAQTTAAGTGEVGQVLDREGPGLAGPAAHSGGQHRNRPGRGGLRPVQHAPSRAGLRARHRHRDHGCQPGSRPADAGAP